MASKDGNDARMSISAVNDECSQHSRSKGQQGHSLGRYKGDRKHFQTSHELADNGFAWTPSKEKRIAENEGIIGRRDEQPVSEQFPEPVESDSVPVLEGFGVGFVLQTDQCWYGNEPCTLLVSSRIEFQFRFPFSSGRRFPRKSYPSHTFSYLY